MSSLQYMMLLLIFSWAFLCVSCDPVQNNNEGNDAIYKVEARDNGSTCTNFDAKMWSHDFHSCFMDRKYKDGGRDLNNIVDRVLAHSEDCIKNSTKHCKPDHKGFLVIMDKIIYEMKDYCFIYLEHIIHDRNKVKDLECIEKSLSSTTYKKCFMKALDQDYSPEAFQREVENSILCTNKSNKQCSKTAKSSLNRIVRNILGVKQPAEENIENDPKPEPPKRWYDYIIQPIINFWKTIKSFFGF